MRLSFIGAGNMGESHCARSLRCRGADSVFLANRTRVKAEALATNEKNCKPGH